MKVKLLDIVAGILVQASSESEAIHWAKSHGLLRTPRYYTSFSEDGAVEPEWLFEKFVVRALAGDMQQPEVGDRLARLGVEGIYGGKLFVVDVVASLFLELPDVSASTPNSGLDQESGVQMAPGSEGESDSSTTGRFGGPPSEAGD